MKRAFTLIEIMVAVAILAILTGIVLVSLQSTQQRARDNKRVGDINQLQLLLNQYYDQNKRYPLTLQSLVTDGYVSVLPVPPRAGETYFYNPLRVAGYSDSLCLAYHLGATLENTGSSQLAEDAGVTFDTYNLCTGASGRFYGEQPTCSTTQASGADGCYNVGSF